MASSEALTEPLEMIIKVEPEEFEEISCEIAAAPETADEALRFKAKV